MTRIHVIIALAIALALSLFVNYRQWSSEIAEDAQHATEVRALTAEANLAAAQQALAHSRGFAAGAARESARIDARFAEIAGEQQKLTDAYWRRLRTIAPLAAGCGPGEERVRAFNDRSEK